MKKVFTFLFLIASTTLAAEVYQLESSGFSYETFQVYESNVNSAAVLVDYQLVETDCHGLAFKYEVKAVAKDRFLVSKIALMKPMVMCSTPVKRLVQAGVKIELPVLKSASGGYTLAEVIVPTGSEVVVQLD